MTGARRESGLGAGKLARAGLWQLGAGALGLMMLSALAAGCGGSSGEDIQAGVHIVFPPPISLAHEPTLVVRGTALLDGGVAAIRVNGIAAESANDFLDWQATVPLEHGINTITVESEDSSGQIDSRAAQVTVELSAQPLADVSELALDAQANRALVLHRSLDLVAIELGTGERSFVTGLPSIDSPLEYSYHSMALDAELGLLAMLLDDAGGPELLYTVDVNSGVATPLLDLTAMFGDRGPGLQVVDPAAHRSLLVLREPVAVIAVELETGAVDVLSDADTGTGPLPGQPASAAWDAANTRLLVADSEQDVLLAVNGATGSRTMVSSKPADAALALPSEGPMVVDEAGNRALIMDPEADVILAVDLVTGERSLLAAPWQALRPGTGGLRTMTMDASKERLLILDDTLEALMALDLASEQLSTVSAAKTGAGPYLLSSNAIALDAASGRALIMDTVRAEILAVDLTTGERTVVFEPESGTGMELGFASDMALDDDGKRAVITNAVTNQVLILDLETGALTDLEVQSADNGPIIAKPMAVAMDGTRALVVDRDDPEGSNNRIIAVDLRTGRRTLVADVNPVTAGEAPDVRAICVDRKNDRALIANLDTGSVWTVELDGGDIELLSAVSEGDGPLLRQPAAIFLDARTERALVVDRAIGALYEIDLDTGDRTLVAGQERGNGPAMYGLLDGVVDMTAGRALLVDALWNAVLSVDLKTGERVVLSGG